MAKHAASVPLVLAALLLASAFCSFAQAPRSLLEHGSVHAVSPSARVVSRRLLWGVTSTTKSTVGNVGTYSSARPGGLALSLADVKVYSDSKTYVDNSQLKRARVSTTTANSGRATSEAWGDGYSASITKLEHGTSNTIQALPK